MSDGEVLPFAGGIRAVHAPGHCAGQLAFFWPRHGGVLLRGRRRGQRGGPPGPLPRPRGPGRGEAQREEARRIGLRNGLLRPRPGDPARGVSALQKGFRGRPEGNSRVGYLESCDIPLASIGIILASFLCVRSSPPAGLLTLSPLAREGNPRPGARKSRSLTLRSLALRPAHSFSVFSCLRIMRRSPKARSVRRAHSRTEEGTVTERHATSRHLPASRGSTT